MPCCNLAARHVISIILNLQFLSFYICYFVQSFPQNLVTIKAKHIYHKPNLNRQRDIICQYNRQTVCSAPYYSVSAVYLTPLRHMPPTTLPLNMSSLLQTICLSFVCLSICQKYLSIYCTHHFPCSY